MRTILPAAITVVAMIVVCSGLSSAAEKPAEVPISLAPNATGEQVRDAYQSALAEALDPAKLNEGDSLKRIEQLIHYAARPGAEAERSACCLAATVAVEGEKTTAAQKLWLLQLLNNAGREEVVPALAKLLAGSDPLLRESARRALQANPSDAAAAALRAAAQKETSPEFRAALILALGARRDAASAGWIGSMLRHDDPRVKRAAVEALGDLASGEAAAALAGWQPPKELIVLAAESHMKCAERFAAAGKASDAAAVYQRYLGAPQRSVRLAALAGAIRTAGEGAASMILGAIKGGDPDARAVALTAVADLPQAQLAALARDGRQLPPQSAAALLAALAARGEKAALPIALQLAQSDDVEVRKTALRALGDLGDESLAGMLFDVVVTNDPDGVARESLIRLTGSGVNQSLVGLLEKTAEPARKQTLVELLDARGAPELVPAAISLAKSDNVNLARTAARSLGKLARPDQAEAVIALLLSARGELRDELERAVMFVCQRIDGADAQAEPVIKAYQQADAAGKALLLPALGRIGGTKALEAVRAGLGADDTLRRAAVRALSNWPDESAIDDLLAAAENAKDAAERAMLLRAAVRVATARESKLPDPRKLAVIGRALEQLERDPDKAFVLERAGEIRRVDTLRLLAPYLDRPALRTAAGRAIVNLAHHGGLRSRERQEYIDALNKIIAAGDDRGLVDRAKEELERNQ